MLTHVLNDDANPVSDEGLGRVKFLKIVDEINEHTGEHDVFVETIIGAHRRKC